MRAGPCTNPAAFDFASATKVAGLPAPQPQLTAQAFAVSGLDLGAYCFALETADAATNSSALSNLAQATVADTVAPQTAALAQKTPALSRSVQLTWTAPDARDGLHSAAAASYELRSLAEAGCPITAANFATGTLVTTGTPAAPGAPESVVVTGFAPLSTRCFALRSTDLAGNVSALSPSLAATSGPDTTPPDAPAGLALTSIDNTTARLTWTETADDPSTTLPAASAAVYAEKTACPITSVSGLTAKATVAPAAAPGQADTALLTGLSVGTAYCFAVTVTDPAGNTSAPASVAGTTTSVDLNAPAAITDLSASLALSGRSALGEPQTLAATLSWTAPVDADAFGAAADVAGYQIAAATDLTTPACPLTAANFASATKLSSPPAPAHRGQAETFAFTLAPGASTYCFATASVDASGNRSPISNLATPPGLAALSSSGLGDTAVTLSFTETGDDGIPAAGATGVTKHELRYRTGDCPITAANFDAAGSTAVDLSGIDFKSAGGAVAVPVAGLAQDAAACFALRLTDGDARPNRALSSSLQVTPGHLHGAKYDAAQGNVTFRVFSSRATRVEVWLYDTAQGAQEVARLSLEKDGASLWSKSLPAAELAGYGAGAVYYGYRAWGPNWPYDPSWVKGSGAGFVSDVDAAGNRFNPNKLLFDPYATELSHDPNNAAWLDGALYATGDGNRNRDSGAQAPKGLLLAPDPTSTGTKPTRALKDDVVYEVHVRGLTMSDPSVAAGLRGTYAGAASKAASLAALGVTAVELLPVQETQNDTNDVVPDTTAGDNYWGYMTLNYFSPDRRYSSDKSPGGPTREFKAMVKAFHDAGLKVFIDVVYNHTGEGGPWGNTDGRTVYNLFSFRGLDNPTYYSLTGDYQYPWDNTGVGGNYNTHNPVAQDLIVDSLVWWRDALGVDGFRFDLASVLGNTCEHGCYNFDKLDAGNALNRIVRDLGVRPAAGGSGVDLIAEPWAIGGNSYQVGGFPTGWSEWNGIYRDSVRKAQNLLGVATVTTGELATRFAGSSDLFGDDGRKPFNSINFLVAHDGFTLRDLYSYNTKQNGQAWPYGPSDGGDDTNNSWDQGGAYAEQKKAARTGLALLLLSGGTPMFTGGDEYYRTQRGNNNAYNLDSAGNWLDYGWSTDQTNFRAFAQRLLQFRNAHPALRPAEYYSGSDTNGNVMEQLRWFQPNGAVADANYFTNGSNHSLAWRLDGTEFGDPASALYVAYNGWSGSVNFTLPWPGTGKSWYRVMDDATWAEGPDTVAAPGTEVLIGGEGTVYGLEGRAVLLLIAK
jgi:glycogen operon protein